MKKITFVTGFLLLTCIVNSGIPAHSSEEETAVLENLLKQALENNPEIKAAEENWTAAMNMVPQARSLPDPQLGYTYIGESIETKNGPQENAYRLSQMFPSFGKLRLRGEVAEEQAKISEENFYATRRKIIAEVKKTYYELYWVYKATEITEEIKALLEKFEKIAEIRYATGKGHQQNVLRAQVEISKLIDKLLLFEEMKTTVLAKLNKLLNRTPEAPVGKPGDFEVSYLPAQLDELYNLGEKNRQELRAAKFAIEKAEAAYSLARKQYLPDFTIGASYIEIGPGDSMSPDSGQDSWMVTFGINLPIRLARLRGAVNEAKDKLEESKNKFQDMRNMTSFEIKDTFFRLETRKQMIELYRDALIPQAEQSMKSTQAAYETGNASFLDLLDSERALLGIRIAYYRAVADYEKTLADLERAVGADLK